MKKLRLTLAVASLGCLSICLAYLPLPEQATASTPVEKIAAKIIAPVIGVVAPPTCGPTGCNVATRGLLVKRTRTVERKVETTATTEVTAERTRRQPVRNILKGARDRQPIRSIAGRLLRRR